MKPSIVTKLPSPLVLLLSIISLCATLTVAEGPTRIFIDQIPLYTRIAPCVEDRISAIVRAQFSGCGDGRQLTSFSCFCIDSSTEFNSIISTAVEEQCALTREGLATVTSGSPGPEVTDALNLFSSYCAKSTMLTGLTPVAPAVITVTQPPQTVTAPFIASATAPSLTPPSSPPPDDDSSSGVPLAAIVVPSVLVPIAVIAALVWFFLRRRQRSRSDLVELPGSEDRHSARISRTPKELIGDMKEVQEMATGEKGYAHELESPVEPAELDGGFPLDWKKRSLDLDEREVKSEMKI